MKKTAFAIDEELRNILEKEGSVRAFVATFEELTSNADKIKLCYAALKATNLLPQREWMTAEKSETRAVAARQKGNQYFKEQDYTLALEAYNRSLCHAPLNSESVGIGYANRSAIYLNAGFFEYCLENIEHALRSNYPDKLKPKLLQRREECLKLMNNAKDSLEVYGKKCDIKISYPPNPRMPFAIDSLECRDNSEYGRHIVTNTNLKPGDVIIVEKPHFQTLHRQGIYSHCTNCALNKCFNLQPCAESTTALFCNDHCFHEAWERFLKYEFPISKGILDIFTDVSIDSIRATLKTFTMFKNLNDLKKFLASIEGTNETAFDLDWTTKADECAKFKIIYSMATNQEKRSMEDVFQCANYSAIAWRCFKEFTEMKEILENSENEDLFLELLMKFYQIIAVSFHETAETVRRSEDEELEATPFSPRVQGSGAFPLSSLINHSCIPNLIRTSVRGLNILIVIRPVKAGDQLFDNYGPHYFGMSRQDRHQILMGQYHFDCNCEACRKNYPTFDKMQTKNVIPLTIIQNGLNMTETEYDDEKNKALSTLLFYQICNFLSDVEIHTPCYDIFKLHQYFIQLFRFLYNPLPLELMLKKKY